MFRGVVLSIILILPQLGCDAEYGENLYPYVRGNLTNTGRLELESQKREFLEIKEIKIGDGPIAAWGRRLKADVEVRYTDGSLVYRGPIVTYVGFHVALQTGLKDSNLLPWTQEGIQLGLNGMAVGGRRRFTVDRKLVCTNLPLESRGNYGCILVKTGNQPGDWPIRVRKEQILVEATLKESCIPLSFRALRAGGSYMIYKQIGCRDSKEPVLTPTAPIWVVY